jgi:hypothetical protein
LKEVIHPVYIESEYDPLVEVFKKPNLKVHENFEVVFFRWQREMKFTKDKEIEKRDKNKEKRSLQ